MSTDISEEKYAWGLSSLMGTKQTSISGVWKRLLLPTKPEDNKNPSCSDNNYEVETDKGGIKAT